MNIQEITTRLYAIGEAILEKTGERPWHGPELTIKDGRCEIVLHSGWRNGNYVCLNTASKDTPDAALDDADRIIAALPEPETANLQAYMASVAACADKAKSDNIPDEYVTPLRMTIAAMTSNLLTVRAAE